MKNFNVSNSEHMKTPQGLSESDFDLQTGNRLYNNDKDVKHNQWSDLENFLKSKYEFPIKDTTSNPGPLGLLGFGLTTFLLNLHNAGVYPMNSAILAMGICYGGLAQIIAGLFEWHKNRIFTSVVFISYGTFWWSLCLIIILPNMGVATATDKTGMAWYLFIWGLISFGFLICTLKKPRIIFLIFATLVPLFWLLAIENWADDPNVGKAAGVDGIICGLLAIYAGLAELINETFGRTILPMGIPKVSETKYKV